jgi:hypothetical protein
MRDERHEEQQHQHAADPIQRATPDATLLHPRRQRGSPGYRKDAQNEQRPIEARRHDREVEVTGSREIAFPPELQNCEYIRANEGSRRLTVNGTTRTG